MNKLQLLTNQFLKLAQNTSINPAQNTSINPKDFIQNLIKEISNIYNEIKSFPNENDKNISYLKYQFGSYVLNDVISMMQSNFDKKYTYLTNPDQKNENYLDSIYVGTNNLVNFFIHKTEQLKNDFKNSNNKVWYDESFNVLSFQEKMAVANNVLDKVLKVLHEYADQEFPTERRVLERLDRDV